MSPDAAGEGLLVTSALPRLMLVTDRRRFGGRHLVGRVAAAVRAGVRLVQVREKDLSDEELLSLVAWIRDACGAIELLVNDRPAVARRAATGLHLPAASLPLADRVGIAALGRSAHDAAEARAAATEGVDYVVVGTLYPTGSKPDVPGAGPERLGSLVPIVVPAPVYAIGGIDAARVEPVMAAGAHGVAVCGAILGARDPRAAASELLEAVERATRR